jgi:Rieske Fe-S protein
MLMSAVSSSPTWRTFLVTVAAAGAFGLVLRAAPSDAQTVPPAGAQASLSGLGAAVEDTAVRPFHIDVPEEALTNLRRLAVTQWPERYEGIDRDLSYVLT